MAVKLAISKCILVLFKQCGKVHFIAMLLRYMRKNCIRYLFVSILACFKIKPKCALLVFRSNSLTKGFLKLAMLYCFIAFIILSAIAINVWNTVKKEEEYKLKQYIELIEWTFNDNINEVKNYARFIASIIAKEEYSIANIEKILTKNAAIHPLHSSSVSPTHSNFAWIDDSNHLVVNSVWGKFEVPVKSSRRYLKDTKAHPGAFIFLIPHKDCLVMKE